MCGEVEGNGQVLVLLNCGAEPLLAVFGKVVVGQEGYCQWDIGFWRREIAIKKSFVNDVKCSAAAGFLKVGSHASNGVDFQVCMSAASQFFCCFKGRCCVFGKVAEKSESMMFGGGEEVWLSECVLALPQTSKESFAGG